MSDKYYEDPAYRKKVDYWSTIVASCFCGCLYWYGYKVDPVFANAFAFVCIMQCLYEIQGVFRNSREGPGDT